MVHIIETYDVITNDIYHVIRTDSCTCTQQLLSTFTHCYGLLNTYEVTNWKQTMAVCVCGGGVLTMLLYINMMTVMSC